MDDGIKLVLDALSKTELGKRIDDTKVVIRCPICGEGSKHRTHGHCYIGMPNDGPPLLYHCFINECSGIVTPNFLRDAGVFDTELESILNVFNKSTSHLSREARKIIYIKNKITDIKVPKIKDNPYNQKKLNYLRSRIGINFSYENARSLKIIFSIKDFLELNDLRPNEKNKWYINTIDKDYIGFLSVGNDYIVFRDASGIKSDKRLRYVKYDIFGSVDNSSIIYNLPGVQCDAFAKEVVLNVAEGPFDVLGIFCNVHGFNRVNHIYAACCGSGYMNTIKYFIKMGFIGNLVVNIYSDDDKKPYYYAKVYSELSPWVKSINVIYNKKSKDFGVRKTEIEISKVSNKYFEKIKR